MTEKRPLECKGCRQWKDRDIYPDLCKLCKDPILSRSKISAHRVAGGRSVEFLVTLPPEEEADAPTT